MLLDLAPKARGSRTPLGDEEVQRSLAHLAAIVASSDDAIISKNLDGRIQSWNAAAERIFGYSAEEAVGQLITLIVPPELHHEEKRILEALRRGEHIQHYETTRITKAGQRVDVSLTVSPVRDARGAIVGASKVARDITARKRAEAALLSSEQRLAAEAEALVRLNEWSAQLWRHRSLEQGYEAMIEAVMQLLCADIATVRVPDESGGLVIVGQRGLPRDYLQRFGQMPGFGASASRLALRVSERVLITDTETVALPEATRLQMREAGCRALIAEPLCSSEGRLVAVLTAGFRRPHRPSDQELGRLALYARQAGDFIQRCLNEQVLREREEALRRADRQKDEFLALLSHELRNPLAPICNASELLARTLGDQPQAQAGVALIQRQAWHLSRLVDDLLDVARITQGRIELQRRTLDLADVIAQAVETVEPLMRDKQHQLTVVSSHQPLYVEADAVRLAQCVGNLLTNAAKYTDPHGRIRIESRTEGAFALIEVSDNGSGIAPELLPHIFDLFVQADRTLDRAQGGLGIGLQVVKKLIEMHGGSVSAHSQGAGRGATFALLIPRVQAQASHTEGKTVSIEPRRIFIVDDNVDGALSLALLLQVEGHEVETAHDWRTALERIEAFAPQVALLDIGIPQMSGYELLQRMRAMPSLRAVRFIALTGYGQAEDRESIRRAGFAAHLVKPVSLEVLNRVVSGELPADLWGDRGN